MLYRNKTDSELKHRGKPKKD